jgi:mono/diheme cytochrome c family protein
MDSGFRPATVGRCRRVPMLVVGLVIACAAGCNSQSYGPAEYPVRTDWIVRPQTWEIQPVRFNLPGYLPLDHLRQTLTMPESEVSRDQLALRGQIDKQIFDPMKLSPEVRAEYGKYLTEMFGTPAAPKVGGFNAEVLKLIDEELTASSIVQTLRVSEDQLKKGAILYRDQCMHCHGLEGNGRGPTGYWVNPPPRDYRQGIFKFTSSSLPQGERKPRLEDLLHVLTTGIDGTSMPSFGLLKQDEREAIVSYVIQMSMRGEVEYLTMYDQLYNNEKQTPLMTIRTEDTKPTLKGALEDNQALIASRWVNAQKPDAAIIPTPYPYPHDDPAFLESAGRGGKVFLGIGGCISCHQNYGRESNLVYDDWGTIVRGRNLYEGHYRGGRRPLDLYYRVHSGIKGAGMTAYKDLKAQMKPEDVGLNEEQFQKIDVLWDLVNFMRAAAYPELRRELREKFQLNMPD